MMMIIYKKINWIDAKRGTLVFINPITYLSRIRHAIFIRGRLFTASVIEWISSCDNFLRLSKQLP